MGRGRQYKRPPRRRYQGKNDIRDIVPGWKPRRGSWHRRNRQVGTLIGLGFVAVIAVAQAFASGDKGDAWATSNAEGTGGDSFACASTHIIDGDTFARDGRRVRFAGIDAPELPGHCRKGRTCTPGDPYASTKSLSRLAAAGSVSCLAVDTDHYGRTVARCTASGEDLFCKQLENGHAVRRYGDIAC